MLSANDLSLYNMFSLSVFKGNKGYNVSLVRQYKEHAGKPLRL